MLRESISRTHASSVYYFEREAFAPLPQKHIAIAYNITEDIAVSSAHYRPSTDIDCIDRRAWRADYDDAPREFDINGYLYHIMIDSNAARALAMKMACRRDNGITQASPAHH